MKDDNPFQAGVAADGAPMRHPDDEISTERATYNIVSDTVTGVNFRKRDNLFQGLFILVAALLLAGVGAVLAWFNPRWDLPWYGGALFGGFAGLVIGFFVSGLFLMVFRMVRHLQGRHQ